MNPFGTVSESIQTIYILRTHNLTSARTTLHPTRHPPDPYSSPCRLSVAMLTSSFSFFIFPLISQRPNENLATAAGAATAAEELSRGTTVVAKI